MEENCVKCGCKLTEVNCTMIGDTCDNCLADQAADDRVAEWENCPTWEK